MTISKLTIEHIARIEGHGNVMVDIQDGELRSVEMNINEPARLFESMVKGRSFEDVAYISSRICGICSPSHVVTSLKATEQAFGVEVGARTKILR
ncbi:MAG: Ni/Fe hydrogenase subunit alpha, partial [Actinobacteria bacterium]|nr:Ni/Fe hydrogenase subunit alpha [Actinomycetota bacterium]